VPGSGADVDDSVYFTLSVHTLRVPRLTVGLVPDSEAELQHSASCKVGVLGAVYGAAELIGDQVAGARRQTCRAAKPSVGGPIQCAHGVTTENRCDH